MEADEDPICNRPTECDPQTVTASVSVASEKLRGHDEYLSSVLYHQREKCVNFAWT